MTDNDEAVAPADNRWFEALWWHRWLQESPEAELTPDRIHAWREWVSDDQNRRVFDQLSQLVEDGPILRRRNLLYEHDAQEDALGSAASVAPDSQPRTTSEVPGIWPRTLVVFERAKFAVNAAVVTAIVGILFALVKAPHSWWASEQSRQAHIYETGVGEVQNILLEDGSSVILGAQSSIIVRFSSAHRSVRLDRGEAWFKIAHAPSRPFVVTAGPRTITAVGTAFVVERDTDRVVVTVTEGAVQVASGAATGLSSSAVRAILSRVHPEVARLARGEKVSYEDSGSASPVEHADAASATAWSEGRLEFDHIPLSRVTEVVNRYSRRTITLDPAIGEQIFTGLVLQEQIDNWICGLEDIFPVQIVNEGERVLVRPRMSGTVPLASRCNPSR